MSEVEKFTATKECSIGGLQMNGGTVKTAKITNNGKKKLNMRKKTVLISLNFD